MNILNDISKVYLEAIATEAAKPDYLDFDKDGNKKESMKKALKDKKEVTEAVRGQDTEMRKAASAERRAGDTLTKKLPPSKGKQFGQYQSDQISYIDKKTKGKHIPGLAKEALDPVGHEDADIDNDGDTDKSDKYLHKRRKAIGKAIATKKESFSNWRQDLAEVIGKDTEDSENHKEIKEKTVNNKIIINPELKEAVEEIGGVLLEMVELNEAYQPIDKKKEGAMYRRAGNLARTALSSTGKKKEVAQTKSSKIVSAITRQKEKERFDRIGQSPTHNEAFVDPEHGEAPSGRSPLQNVSDHPKASVRKTAVKGFKKQMGKEYGGSWKSRSADPVGEEYQVDEGMHRDAKTGEIVSKAVPGRTYYPAQPMKKTSVAIEKEKRMKNEEVEIQEGKQPFPAKKVAKQMEKARKGSVYGKPASNEPAPKVSDSEKKETTRYSKMFHASQKAKREKQEADKARRSSTFYKDTHPASSPKMKKANEEFELDEKTLTPAETKKKEEIVKSMKKSAADFEKRYPGRGKEVMYATATKQAKKVAEAVADQAALSPQELQKQKQKAQLDTQIAMLRKQSLSKAQKPEVAKEEYIDERRKEDKVAGTPRKPRNPAFELVAKSMGTGRMGVQPRGKKKEPGKKPPTAGEYGAPKSPAQKVAARRASAQRAQDMMHSPRD